MSPDTPSDDAAPKKDAAQDDAGDGNVSDKAGDGDGAEEVGEDAATRDSNSNDEGETNKDLKPEEEEETAQDRDETKNVGGDDNGDNYDGDGADYEGRGDGASPAKKPTSGLVIGLVIAVGVAAFFAGAYSISMYQDQPDQLTQEDLDDALAKLELKMMQQQMAALQEQQQQPPPIRISADDDPTIGDADAPITIIEFSDFQCPFCARFSSQTLPSIQEEYIDKGLVKLVYRDFPLQHIHPNAAVTALAAECADDQGGFKGMHDILFEKQGEWSDAGPQEIIELLSGYASDTGIDVAEFDECVAMGTHIEDIGGDLEDGRAYGVTGTPGFFIGNDDVGYVSVEGAQPYDVFKRVIDSQLER